MNSASMAQFHPPARDTKQSYTCGILLVDALGVGDAIAQVLHPSDAVVVTRNLSVVRGPSFNASGAVAGGIGAKSIFIVFIDSLSPIPISQPISPPPLSTSHLNGLEVAAWTLIGLVLPLVPGREGSIRSYSSRICS